MTEQEVTERILEAMEWMDGDGIANLHNEIIAEKIKYTGDSQWDLTGEDESRE